MHTEGPWVGVVDRTEDGEFFTVHPAMRDGQIALVTGENASDDAYLITAAPDLYDAVKMLLPLALGYAPAGQTDEAKASCARRISAARAALEKAEGTNGSPQADGAKDSEVTS